MSSQSGNTSRTASGADVEGIRPPRHNCVTPSVHSQQHSPNPNTQRQEQTQGRRDGNPQLLALREGEALPAGYKYLVQHSGPERTVVAESSVRAGQNVGGTSNPTCEPRFVGPQSDMADKRAVARRNATINLNKKANATFAKEMKESLAEGRPIEIKIPGELFDLKARWHAAAKEAAYKILDVSKEGWKEFSIFDREKVHTELNDNYKFDPPLDPKSVDKYLSGHLRTSRAIWKAHWAKYGVAERHHNCPAHAWAKLIEWWPTEACMEESAKMASRRTKIQSSSKTGRKSLLDRMNEEVCIDNVAVVWENHCI